MHKSTMDSYLVDLVSLFGNVVKMTKCSLTECFDIPDTETHTNSNMDICTCH